jgi:hypothetical protein
MSATLFMRARNHVVNENAAKLAAKNTASRRGKNELAWRGRARRVDEGKIVTGGSPADGGFVLSGSSMFDFSMEGCALKLFRANEAR